MGLDHRKVMSLGKTSTVISLPRKWLEMNGLEKGSLVSLSIQRNGSLVVTPVSEEHELQREIKMTVAAGESGDSVTRRIVACFLDGYSKLVLVSKVFSPEQQQAIRKIVSVLYMMVEESESGRVVIRSLVDDSKTSPISCFERMHAITGGMFRDLLRAMREGNSELAKSVVSIEGDVDQLELLVFRLIRVALMSPNIAESMGLDSLDCLEYEIVVQRVQRVADAVEVVAKNIAEVIDSGPPGIETVSGKLIDLAECALNMYQEAVGCFMSGDLDSVDKVLRDELWVDSVVKDVYGEVSAKRVGEVGNSAFVSSIVIANCLREVAHYSADIAELTIDRAYKSRPD
jgi:phosphate uptake regulator